MGIGPPFPWKTSLPYLITTSGLASRYQQADVRGRPGSSQLWVPFTSNLREKLLWTCRVSGSTSAKALRLTAFVFRGTCRQSEFVRTLHIAAISRKENGLAREESSLLFNWAAQSSPKPVSQQVFYSQVLIGGPKCIWISNILFKHVTHASA
eukprot:1151419-Pelagomonas_calceolata.AAC.2